MQPSRQPHNMCPNKKGLKIQGVIDQDGYPAPTPHHYFVDYSIYANAEMYNRLEQTIAAGIKIVYLILGEPYCTSKRGKAHANYSVWFATSPA